MRPGLGPSVPSKAARFRALGLALPRPPHLGGGAREALLIAILTSTALAGAAASRAQEPEGGSALQARAPGVSPCDRPDARIGATTVERFDVFDTGRGGMAGWIARSANALHVQTRERVVRRHLLFREGEACSSEALAQSERNLRATGLFQRVEVLPSSNADGTVDVRVRVWDAWSLRVTGDYGRVGGVPLWDVGLADTNIAGTGAALGVRRRSGFEADVTTAWFDDQRLLGLRERLALRADRRSDGRANAISLTRPFYAIDSRWGHELAFAETHDHLRLYEDGLVRDEFGRRAIEAIAGVAARVAMPSSVSAWRVAAGFRLIAREHESLDGRAAQDEDVPPSRRWGGPYVNLHFVHHRYIKRTGLFVPGRDVDINLGTQVDVGTFISSPIASLDTSALVSVGSSVSHGWLLPDDGMLLGSAFLSGRYGGTEPRRGDVGGALRAWWQLSPTRVRAALLEARGLVNAEGADRLYLGGTPGLRGYREYQFYGTRRALLIVEERKYFDWTLAGLLQFGVAGFVEAGAMGGAPGQNRRWRLAGDVGVGLRIAQLRTASNSPIRMDVAFPVTAVDGRRRLQLVIGYRGDF